MKFVKVRTPIHDRDQEILQKIFNKDVVVEFVPAFHSMDFYNILSQTNTSFAGGEGCSIVAFNIDLHRLDYSLLERLALAQENSYIPMFNLHEMVSNAFCFKLCSDLTKFAIEFLYKKHFFKKSARNFLHSLTKNINKKDFFVDRNLYNLSENWNVISSYQNHSSSNFPAYPKVIYIGLLNVCNIGCPTCPWFSKEHSKTLKNSYFDIIRKLDRVAIETILDYASEGDCRLVFSGPGEPL